ncbi:Rv1733c family protein [Streptomyces tricolor]|nr:hypothetical protein TUE45_pSRTUE45c_0044 [Streptomyces reticuli]
MRKPRTPRPLQVPGPPGGGHGAPHGRARNPLERPVDRLERRLRVVLTVLALVLLPLAGWGAGQAVYGHHAQERQARLAQLTPVTARLLTDARPSDDRPGAPSRFHASVRWSDRDGDRTGVAPVRAWSQRGDTTTVWLDARGAIATPPEGRDVAATAGIAVAIATVLAGVATAYGVWRAVDRGIGRRRLAQWGREWERVEPGWQTRYGR